MRYIAAYILAVMGGNSAPTRADLKTILGSVGVDIDEDRLSMVLKELSGKDVEELIEKGQSLLASAMSAGPAAPSLITEEVVEEKKDEQTTKKDEAKVENSDSDDEDTGIFTLFD